jgi:plastocyanin
MARALLPAICAALLAAGCGSSGSSPAKSASTGTPTQSTRKPTSHLSLETTPRFAAPSSALPVQSGRVRITYRFFTIDPDVVRVKAGSTLEWTNTDPGPDNVTSVGAPEAFSSPTLPTGATFRVRLSKPGIYHYESTLHPASMNGTIEVLR